MFKGRFGDFYLIKVWIFILVIGSIIFPFLHFKLKSESKLMIGIIEFIFFEIFLGFFISIPSLLISNIFYIIMSKQKFSDIKVFVITFLISFVTTLSTYVYLFNLSFSNYKTNNGGLIFCILFSLLLLIGLVIFKNSDNQQLTTNKQNI